ncbi:hypothetical protein [Priestia megaterium]|uniref:hypothetical protein n=1 Tax=Priestia megaterium TaxID=1404 RepID=UPI002E2354CE|nr:hypothetical protein [Priestia megaterium]
MDNAAVVSVPVVETARVDSVVAPVDSVVAQSLFALVHVPVAVSVVADSVAAAVDSAAVVSVSVAAIARVAQDCALVEDVLVATTNLIKRRLCK